MNLTINSLPARTWNRLGMNETNLTAEGSYRNHTPNAPQVPTDVLWNPKADTFPEGLHADLEELTASADTALAETKKDTVMTAPLILNYSYESDEKAISRLVLHAEENSTLRVLLLFKSGDAPTESALQVKVYADQHASVELFAAQLLGKNSICMNSLAAVCGEDAALKVTRLELGASRSYTGAVTDLKGDRCSFTADLGYHGIPGQVIDMNYVATHYGRETESLMEISGTLEDNSKKIFRGTIDFQRGCSGSKGTENENVLLLGETMVNQTIPLILCQEDDVEGNHGASIGRLDDKMLFYLESRGISEEAAQKMIAEARIEALCSKIPDEAVQKEIRAFGNMGGKTDEPEV